MKHKIKWLFFLSIAFAGCNDDLTEVNTPAVVSVPEVKATSGTADFSKYVALGDSFATGYGDGALFITGQKNAYPAILAQQMVEAGGGVFKTPFMNDNLGGLLLGGNQIPGVNVRLYFNALLPSPAPEPVAGTPTTEVSQKLTGSFNNLGVPGAKSFHLIAPNYGNIAGVATRTANPYFVRFASSSSTTVLADAVAQAPTFFSLWIGGNDVLGYATSGGVPKSQDAIYGDDITPTATFQFAYDNLIAGLTANKAKGVVANLPTITTLPHFTTVPYNPLTVSLLGSNNVDVGKATITALNTQLYGPLKQALTAFGAGDRINLLDSALSNPLLIRDETLTNLSAQLTAAFTPTLGVATATFYGQVFGQARQTKSSDLILLTTRSVIGTAPAGVPAPLDKYGITYPLEDKHALIPSEIEEIKTATVAYNSIIKANADAKGLAFVDSNAFMSQLQRGIVVDNLTLSSTYVSGGTFSLDGIHPTARGYALISNLFVDAINLKYGATLKKVNLTNYSILYPKEIK